MIIWRVASGEGKEAVVIIRCFKGVPLKRSTFRFARGFLPLATGRSLLAAFLLLGLGAWSASAQQAAKYFEDNCTTCHTIGGGNLVGPDLKDVTKRKPRAWLEHFIQDPEAVINSGDAYALQLKKDADDMTMPTLGVQPEMAKALLDMIEEKSEHAASAPAPAATASAAPTSATPASGGGQQAAEFFQKSCKACHTIGGGRLVGPDLKDVTKRKDRAWLEKFIQNPKALIDSGDKYAVELKEDARGIVMPTLGVQPEMAKALLDFIEHPQATTAAPSGGAPSGGAEQPLSASAQPAADFFQKNCKSCHSIGGGRLVGPDLKDVTKRKDRAWLEKFIQDPKAVIDSGDKYAVELKEDARGIVMPTLGVQPPMAKALLDFLEHPQATAAAAAAGVPSGGATSGGGAEHPLSASAQQAADFFQKNCKSCHSIGGGRLVGPDLKDVVKRKDRPWLEHFIQNPTAVIDSGDAYAQQLKQDARGIVMPTISGITPTMASLLLEMIEEKSEHGAAGAEESGVSDRPFTAADLALGTAIFRGEHKLSGGGPACISCHTLGSIGGMGGGRLGPDLTLVYERLNGRKAIAAWLSDPATPTMQAVFRQHALKPQEEILPLLAVFENAARNSQPADATTQINFLMAGFAGLCLGLSAMGWAWRERLRNVRRKMVSVARGEE